MSNIRARRVAAAATDNPVYLERQKAIREAAGEVFREKGFHATKLGDVADRVGMDRASLYYYIGSKDDLFRDVVSGAVAANVADAEEISAMDVSASEKILRLIGLLMQSFERHYPYLYVFVQEDLSKLSKDSGTRPDRWDKTLRQSERYFAIVRSIVSRGFDDGELSSKLPPSVVANSIIGMLNSTRLWFHPGGVLSAEEIGKGLAELVLDGLRITQDKATDQSPARIE
jgi:TetR/AcrR family transcriptional regulator, cholesterol catabolism regulator